MIGVIPEPADRKSAFAGSGSGRTNSPAGGASRTTVPGATPLTRCCEANPSGIARTVMTSRRPSRDGGVVSEYERQTKRPSICTPMPMYCPAACSNSHPQPGSTTIVAASSASGVTLTMRPRSSRADHSGLIRVR